MEKTGHKFNNHAAWGREKQEAAAALRCGGRCVSGFDAGSDLEVHRGRTLIVLLEGVVLAGQDGVEQDAHDGGDSQTRQGHDADLDAAGVGDADGEHEDERGDDDVAGVGEVDLVLDDVAHADSGDHAVEHEGHAADGGRRHGGHEGREFRAEGHDDRNAGRDADHAGIVDAGQGEHAGVLTVGGVGRSAEEGSEGGGQAVAQQGAVEAGVDHEVLAAGGGDGADIADVLDHGGKGQGHDRQHGGPEDAAVDRAGEEVEHAVFPEDRQAEPLGTADGSGDGGALRGINDECEDVRAEHAEQDRDDLGHALAPHVEADDDQDRDDGDEPVGTAVGDGGRGQRQADGDDDRAGDDRREVAHDFLDAEDLEQCRQDDVHQARDGDAEAGVCQQVVVVNGGAVGVRADGAHGVVAADEGERAAEEGRDLTLGQQVEQQRADAGKQ